MLKQILGRTARLDAIKADIAQNLDQCDLSITHVAARQRVTPRYVQMLFERDGTTFSRFVLQQRLGRAHAMLAELSGTGWTIAGIAFEAGFGDLSYFNRTFRQHFGASPTDVRKAARYFLVQRVQAPGTHNVHSYPEGQLMIGPFRSSSRPRCA